MTNIDNYLINEGQSAINEDIIEFCNSIGSINTIDDIDKLDKLFFESFHREPSDNKFGRTAIDIFETKSFSGCSDIGLIVSSILRQLGVPTVYVETAKLPWIKDMNQDIMEGHIFLEIYLDNTWYLYDPTRRRIYLNYDNTNVNYPGEYILIAKSMNPNSRGVCSVQDAKDSARKTFTTVPEYIDPGYEEIDLREKNKGLKY